MKREDLYQTALIVFAIIVAFAIAAFIYFELFPEYKTYQYAYEDLEGFRSSYSHEPPAPFSTGIKQIVLPDEKNGPEIIDRCTSCHLATNLPHFSPTRLALDINDNQMFDKKGNLILEKNPDYVWDHLERKIKEAEAHARFQEAENLIGLRTMTVDGKSVDMTKVLAMHPLMPGEKRPFEFHSMEKYGCTSCHGGNGRALVAKRAHGPVFEGEYEAAFPYPKPQFIERDSENDPRFARMYNDKPSHDLIFQTTPLLAGSLIESRCVQCHLSTKNQIKGSAEKTDELVEQKKRQIRSLEMGIENDKQGLISILRLEEKLKEYGYEKTLRWIEKNLEDYRLPSSEIDALEGQRAYLLKGDLPEHMHGDLLRILGNEYLISKVQKAAGWQKGNIDAFLADVRTEAPLSPLSVFAKMKMLSQSKEAVEWLEHSKMPLQSASNNREVVKKLRTNIDKMITNYECGRELYISQACYACHRIAGFSRSSVGPELTKAGNSYPWYIKESIVWPQADLPSSTMPNFRLDHEELEDLMTFLMAQKGDTRSISEVDYAISIKEWEGGKKMPWELPLPPTEMMDLEKGKMIFATEGCAACHKLAGFESAIDFAIEKDPHVTALQKIQARERFSRLFPEQILGSQIAQTVVENGEEIDREIASGVRKDAILEKIELRYPGLISGFYSNFKFAMRARNAEFAAKMENAKGDLEKNELAAELEAYKERIRRVLMVYIQVYGLGRDIAPHINYSGIYRDDAWLIGHFHNPNAYTAKSLMPVMPLDDSKFMALNNLLHHLGKKNRDELHEVWKVKGFDPAEAFKQLCSVCHGENRQGNGIISEWIYPIPKNLRNPVFLASLTKDRAIASITHGVTGTPMPPSGETISPLVLGDQNPVLTQFQIRQIVDWLFQGLPQEMYCETETEYQKWNYEPQDVVQEMLREGDTLQPAPPQSVSGEDLMEYYFEAKPNSISSPDKHLYYIRDSFYTTQNLDQARSFYLVNCSQCHGKDGTGTGLRAASMIEAKPRMFTNLPWIQSRDDIRLLRSIKFGVSGTSMIPWGDATTAAQRMQLAMYIRHLTGEQQLRSELDDIIYEIFDEREMAVIKGRLTEYSELEKIEKRCQELYCQREILLIQVEAGSIEPAKAAQIYEEELSLLQNLEKRKKRDGQYQQLIDLVKEEKVIYSSVSQEMIAKGISEKTIKEYFLIIKNDPLIYSAESGLLQLKFSSKTQKENDERLEKILHYFDERIREYERKMAIEKAKSSCGETVRTMQQFLEEQGSLINLRTKMLIQSADAAKLRAQQLEFYQKMKT